MGECYKQLNSSVGEFGTSTLQASTRALESTSPDDRVYTNTEAVLSCSIASGTSWPGR